MRDDRRCEDSQVVNPMGVFSDIMQQGVKKKKEQLKKSLTACFRESHLKNFLNHICHRKLVLTFAFLH